MKSKKVLAILLALSLSTAVAVSVSAAQLTPTSSTNENTEVTAHINGTTPGEVSYVITIPDKVDFGTLTQPEDDGDYYNDVTYTVTATEITGLSDNQQVAVYVKDTNATSENDQFYITQKTSPNTQLTYDVYAGTPDEGLPVNQGSMGDNGYLLVAFNEQAQEINGTLRLNQSQLYGQDLDTIAGDYSGYMVFHSSVTDSLTQ